MAKAKEGSILVGPNKKIGEPKRWNIFVYDDKNVDKHLFNEIFITIFNKSEKESEDAINLMIINGKVLVGTYYFEEARALVEIASRSSELVNFKITCQLIPEIL